MKRDVELRNRIKVFRAEHDLTQSDLAERIGVSRIFWIEDDGVRS